MLWDGTDASRHVGAASGRPALQGGVVDHGENGTVGGRAGAAAVAAMMLAGCGPAAAGASSHAKHPQQARTASPAPSPTSHREATKPLAGSGSHGTPAQRTAPLPGIVADALAAFGTRYGAFQAAPRVLPALAAGQHWNARTLSAAPMYRVDLYASSRAVPLNSSPLVVGSQVASFSGWQEASARAAAGVFQTVSQYRPALWAHVAGQPTALTAGITAALHQVPGQPASPTVPQVLPQAVLTWQEGRWRIAVADQVKGSMSPAATADAVASYLHTHFLPVPQSAGAISVVLSGTVSATAVQTNVTWQESTRVYSTVTLGTGSQPRVRAALVMAVSMPAVASNSAAAASAVILEHLQVLPNALLITTTHVNMQDSYWDPHIVAGSPPVFEVTLSDASAGKLAVNAATPVKSNWATSEQVVPAGSNVLLKFDLKPGVHVTSTAFGAGDQIQVTFGAGQAAEKSV